MRVGGGEKSRDPSLTIGSETVRHCLHEEEAEMKEHLKNDFLLATSCVCVHTCASQHILCVVLPLSTDLHVPQRHDLCNSLPGRFLINNETPCKMLRRREAFYLASLSLSVGCE